MTDLSRFYYRGTPIYLLILYDAETETIILYQVSPIANNHIFPLNLEITII